MSQRPAEGPGGCAAPSCLLPLTLSPPRAPGLPCRSCTRPVRWRGDTTTSRGAWRCSGPPTTRVASAPSRAASTSGMPCRTSNPRGPTPPPCLQTSEYPDPWTPGRTVSQPRQGFLTCSPRGLCLAGGGSVTSSPPLEIIDEFRCECMSRERLRNFLSLPMLVLQPLLPRATDRVCKASSSAYKSEYVYKVNVTSGPLGPETRLRDSRPGPPLRAEVPRVPRGHTQP